MFEDNIFISLIAFSESCAIFISSFLFIDPKRVELTLRARRGELVDPDAAQVGGDVVADDLLTVFFGFGAAMAGLIQLIRDGVIEAPESAVGPSSVDVTLGVRFLRERVNPF